MNSTAQHWRIVWLVAAAFLCGCASQKQALVLNAVGPPPEHAEMQGSKGYLVVYSAMDAAPDPADTLYRDRYTAYRIMSGDGRQVLRRIRNDNGGLFGNPEEVELGVGSYRVQAQANGYGVVEVPVTIKLGQVTTLHLEGAFSWPRTSRISESNPVRLPGGEIVGWRAAAGPE